MKAYRRLLKRLFPALCLALALGNASAKDPIWQPSPGHLSLAKTGIRLNPDIGRNITLQTPPTLLLQDEDDDSDRVEDSLSYYAALKRVGVPVEMHLYATGGHAFGLRRTKLPVTEWPKLVERWLVGIGMIPD